MGADLGAQETLKTRRFKKRDAFPSLFAWERPVLSRLRVLLPGPFTRLPLRWAEGKAVRRESRWLAGRAAGRWDPALPFREAAGPGMRGRQADCEGGRGWPGMPAAPGAGGLGPWSFFSACTHLSVFFLK